MSAHRRLPSVKEVATRPVLNMPLFSNEATAAAVDGDSLFSPRHESDYVREMSVNYPFLLASGVDEDAAKSLQALQLSEMYSSLVSGTKGYLSLSNRYDKGALLRGAIVVYTQTGVDWLYKTIKPELGQKQGTVQSGQWFLWTTTTNESLLAVMPLSAVSSYAVGLFEPGASVNFSTSLKRHYGFLSKSQLYPQLRYYTSSDEYASEPDQTHAAELLLSLVTARVGVHVPVLACGVARDDDVGDVFFLVKAELSDTLDLTLSSSIEPSDDETPVRLYYEKFLLVRAMRTVSILSRLGMLMLCPRPDEHLHATMAYTPAVAPDVPYYESEVQFSWLPSDDCQFVDLGEVFVQWYMKAYLVVALHGACRVGGQSLLKPSTLFAAQLLGEDSLACKIPEDGHHKKQIDSLRSLLKQEWKGQDLNKQLSKVAHGLSKVARTPPPTEPPPSAERVEPAPPPIVPSAVPAPPPIVPSPRPPPPPPPPPAGGDGTVGGGAGGGGGESNAPNKEQLQNVALNTVPRPEDARVPAKERIRKQRKDLSAFGARKEKAERLVEKKRREIQAFKKESRYDERAAELKNADAQLMLLEGPAAASGESSAMEDWLNEDDNLQRGDGVKSTKFKTRREWLLIYKNMLNYKEAASTNGARWWHNANDRDASFPEENLAKIRLLALKELDEERLLKEDEIKTEAFELRQKKVRLERELEEVITSDEFAKLKSELTDLENESSEAKNAEAAYRLKIPEKDQIALKRPDYSSGSDSDAAYGRHMKASYFRPNSLRHGMAVGSNAGVGGDSVGLSQESKNFAKQMHFRIWQLAKRRVAWLHPEHASDPSKLGYAAETTFDFGQDDADALSFLESMLMATLGDATSDEWE